MPPRKVNMDRHLTEREILELQLIVVEQIRDLMRGQVETNDEIRNLMALQARYTQEILCEVREIRARIVPSIIGITIIVGTADSQEQDMTLTAQAVWSDGFHGFDDAHAKPSDWLVTFTEDSGDASLSDNGDGTALVTAGTTDSVITAHEGSFTASQTITAAAPTITGIEIVVS